MKNQIRYLISSVIAVYLMFGLYTPVSIADTTVIDDNGLFIIEGVGVVCGVRRVVAG